MTEDLLTPSSFAATAICFCMSAVKRNAISGYLEAGAFVLVFVIAFFFLCWLVLHLHYTLLSNHPQPLRALLCALWLTDGYK